MVGKNKMARKKNKTDWGNILFNLAWVSFVIFLIYGYSTGMFNKTNTIVYINNETIIQKLQLPPTGECSLSATPTTTTLGGIIVGTIRDGPLKECIINYKYNGGNWIYHGTVKTNIDGIYTGNQIMPGVGTYEFKAVCGDCPTNSVIVTVNPAQQDNTCMQKALDMGINFNAQPNTPSETECTRIATNMCGNNGIKTKVFTLSDKCCVWECNQAEEPATPKCYENDNGANPSVFSTCYDTTMGKQVEWLMKKDTCLDIKGPLTEWYCDSGICKSKTMECGFTSPICTEGYCHQLLCSDIKDPISQTDCDDGESSCRGDCSYIYNPQTDTDSCQCVSRCSSRYLELGYSYYYYYSEADYPYGQDSRVCSAKANHECVLLGKSVPLWLTVPYGLYGEQLEGRCCMWACV